MLALRFFDSSSMALTRPKVAMAFVYNKTANKQTSNALCCDRDAIMKPQPHHTN